MIVSNIGALVTQRASHANIGGKLCVTTRLGVALHLRVAGVGHGRGIVGDAAGDIENQLTAVVGHGVAIFEADHKGLFVVRWWLELLRGQAAQKCAIVEDTTGREEHALFAYARRTPINMRARECAEPTHPVGEVVTGAHAYQNARCIDLLDGGVLDEFFDGLFGV